MPPAQRLGPRTSIGGKGKLGGLGSGFVRNKRKILRDTVQGICMYFFSPPLLPSAVALANGGIRWML